MRRIRVEPLADIPEEDYSAFIRTNLWDTFYTNSFGFRDEEFHVVKPAGTMRIVVLGDSITSGDNVRQHERYTELVESCLNQNHKGKRFEVMNLGVGGYNTLQEVATLEEKGLLFQPDIVVIAYCLNDDLPYSDGGLYQLLSEQVSSKPTPWIRSFQTPTGGIVGILHKSQLFLLIKYFWITRLGRQETHLDTDILGGDIVEKAFSMLSHIQAKHDFEVLVVVFPYFANMSHYRYASVHSKVTRKAKTHGFDVLDLFDRYARLATLDGKEFRAKANDFCHPNKHGHWIAAQAICETLANKYATMTREKPFL
jgi:hypothetical protein